MSVVLLLSISAAALAVTTLILLARVSRAERRLEYLKACVEHLAGIPQRKFKNPPPAPWTDPSYPGPWDR